MSKKKRKSTRARSRYTKVEQISTGDEVGGSIIVWYMKYEAKDGGRIILFIGYKKKKYYLYRHIPDDEVLSTHKKFKKLKNAIVYSYNYMKKTIDLNSKAIIN